ncbi:MAG: response regulator transcription factor [Gallionella sp.]|nr:response regulator transcription factor [Gallionella sp.]
MRIALLETFATDTHLMRLALENAGYRCDCFDHGKKLISALQRDQYDALILGWQVADMSGMEVLAWVQKNFMTPPPVLLVSSVNEEPNVVDALVNGADDYIVKPIKGAELVARVQACWRRVYRADANSVLIRGAWAFYPSTRVAYYRNEKLDLTGKEFDLAYFLFRYAGSLLSRSHIMENVWGLATEVPTRTLDTHISRVRLKCHLLPEYGFRLASVYGYGYQLEVVASSLEFKPESVGLAA